MKKDKLSLGVTTDGERVWIERHSWDCGRYWGFGYLGNSRLHYHFKQYLDGKHWEVEKAFKETALTQENWWKLCDLFKQAYALKACAEIYEIGGHISDTKSIVNIRDSAKVRQLNADLETVLNAIWGYLTEALTKQNNKPITGDQTS